MIAMTRVCRARALRRLCTHALYGQCVRMNSTAVRLNTAELKRACVVARIDARARAGGPPARHENVYQPTVTSGEK